MSDDWLATPVPLTVAQVLALDDLIERLIAFRDAIDGDADFETDDEDCCGAHDDNPGWVMPWAAHRGPGDPSDAEPEETDLMGSGCQAT